MYVRGSPRARKRSMKRATDLNLKPGFFDALFLSLHTHVKCLTGSDQMA